MKDAAFYTQESTQYSSKRYPVLAKNYIQYFFKDRLKKTLKLIHENTPAQDSPTLLEIGCADGVVLRAITSAELKVFTSLVGIDTATGMIGVAKDTNKDPRISYFVRGEEPSEKYTLVIEVGVANYTDFDTELMYAHEHLRDGGYYILSIAGDGSTNRRAGQGVGYENCYSYSEYEKRISEKFEIIKTIPVGLHIRGFWKVPVLARIAQPCIEAVVRPFAPDLFHEKVYLLKPR